jgi:hypothetical protein
MPTTHLRPAQSRNLDSASRYAAKTDQPFTHAVTIHLKGCSVSSTSEFRGRFWKLFGDWYRKHTALAPSYVWSLENPIQGIHMHASVHVPAKLEQKFRKRVRSWVARCTGTPPAAGMINIQQIAKGVGAGSALYLGGYGQTGSRHGLLGWTGYILKGSTPKTGASMGIATSNQGVCVSKRCGYAQSLGRTRRRKRIFRNAAYRLSIASSTTETTRAFIERANLEGAKGAQPIGKCP